MAYIPIYKCINIILSLFKREEEYINMDTNKEVVSRLKFIAKINKDEKINVRYMYIQPDDMTTRFVRTFYNKDNRNNTLKFVRTTIERGFEIISLYMTSDKLFELTICKNIIKDIKNAKNGINNLKETYSLDNKFCSDMDTILQYIDARLLELESCELFKEETQNTKEKIN